jgi:hypothetical protein
MISSKQAARYQVREELWPGREEIVWPQPRERGWTRTPRTLPVIAEILNSKAVSGGAVDLARTYLTLFCVAFEEGIVEIIDEDAMAAASGLKRKTWTARMMMLQSLGFIGIKAKYLRRIGYVLLLHPVPVIRKLREEGKIEDGLWALFTQWHTEFNCTEPRELTAEDLEVIAWAEAKRAPASTVKALDALLGVTPGEPD